MKSLAELANLYGTDKRKEDHNYVEIYEHILQWFPVKQLLEVGLGNGASVKMWNDYFPNAEIFAMELYGEENKTVWNSFREDFSDITVVEGDSTKAETWEKVPNEMDIIIDDGDHHAVSQIATFMNGFSHLRSQGLYIIEDTHCGFEERFGKENIYPWVLDLITKQQCPDYGTGGDHYKYRKLMEGVSKDIYSYHFYKSLAIFEKA